MITILICNILVKHADFERYEDVYGQMLKEGPSAYLVQFPCYLNPIIVPKSDCMKVKAKHANIEESYDSNVCRRQAKQI